MLRRRLSKSKEKYSWFGDYSSWEKARADVGYDQVILNKTFSSMLKMKNKEAVYERDAAMLDKMRYPHALLAFLIHGSSICRRPLHILDFGGSLGTAYYKVREFLNDENLASWNIVKQEQYVETGNSHFSDEKLKFYGTMDECLKEKDIDFVLVSGFVQYLETPHTFLKELAGKNFGFILFDRTAFTTDREDRITLQRGPMEIHPASFPSWFFHENFFLSHFSDNYRVIAEFPSYVNSESEMWIDGRQKGVCKGFYLINLFKCNEV